jgi:hypothetical protein
MYFVRLQPDALSVGAIEKVKNRERERFLLFSRDSLIFVGRNGLNILSNLTTLRTVIRARISVFIWCTMTEFYQKIHQIPSREYPLMGVYPRTGQYAGTK